MVAIWSRGFSFINVRLIRVAVVYGTLRHDRQRRPLVAWRQTAFTPGTCSRIQVSRTSNLYPDTSGYMSPWRRVNDVLSAIQDTCRRRQGIQMDTNAILFSTIQVQPAYYMYFDVFYFSAALSIYDDQHTTCIQTVYKKVTRQKGAFRSGAGRFVGGGVLYGVGSFLSLFVLLQDTQLQQLRTIACSWHLQH